MYDLDQYGSMITDRTRTGAYQEAIARAVKPGDVVVDLGCGPGLLSLLACRAGARRVYAIETNESVAYARELAEANGYTDRIQILRGSSRHLNLPERADLIVSDVRGVLPLFSDAIASIEDARQRFLAPGGRMIPATDRLYVALASVPEFYAQIEAPWQDLPAGVRLSPMRARAMNNPYSVRFDGDKLASEPFECGRFDYALGAQGRTSAKLRFRAGRACVVHGLCLWFDTILFEEIGYSTGPGGPETVYGQLFLPWLEPVNLEAGEEVVVDLHADPVRGTYIWRWNAAFGGHSDAGRRFAQSTLEGARLAPDLLRRRSMDFVPKLSPTGAAESWVLEHMDGTRSLQELAESVVDRFPESFRNSQEAVELVCRLSDKLAL